MKNIMLGLVRMVWYLLLKCDIIRFFFFSKMVIWDWDVKVNLELFFVNMKGGLFILGWEVFYIILGGRYIVLYIF